MGSLPQVPLLFIFDHTDDTEIVLDFQTSICNDELDVTILEALEQYTAVQR